jgi:hypothetical protein
MKTYISVCKNVILSNLKNGTRKPPIRVSRGLHGRPRHCHSLAFKGRDIRQGRVVYSLRPAPWGARVWIELES